MFDSGRLSDRLTLLLAGFHGVLLLFVTARPIVTDDVWWSLVLGAAFRSAGPWMVQDPLLFTAVSPPDPSAWLFQIVLFTIGEHLGFTGLRAFHVLAVLLILAAVGRLVFGVTRSAPVAALGIQLFIVFAAYRLCQMRAHLVTILLAILLVDGLLRRSDRRWSWVIMVAIASAVWANAHAGFVLAPLIVLLTVVGDFGAAAARGRDVRSVDPPPIRRRLILLALIGTSCLLNPLGLGAYTRLLRSSAETPALDIVADEWGSFDAFSWPSGAMPPSPLAWIAIWCLLAGLAAAAIVAFRWRGPSSAATSSERFGEGTLLASTITIAAGLLLLLSMGVRFLWVGIFAYLPIVLVFDRLASRGSGSSSLRDRGSMAHCGVAAALLLGFVSIGDWTLISPGTPLTSEYQDSYSTQKYQEHAVSFLTDARLKARVFADYHLSGFIGFWSQGELQTFINGSLNVEPRIATEYVEINRAYSSGLSQRELDVLTGREVDLYVGIGMPIAQDPRRPWHYTTAQLEGVEDWMLVFRSARSGVYMHRNDESRSILKRVSDYYAAGGVPFDPEIGFDPARVVDDSPAWAFEHGLIPGDYVQLVRMSNFGRGDARIDSMRRLALVYASLGIYDRAASLEAGILASKPGDETALRRRLWALLRLQEREAVRLAVAQLEGCPNRAVLSRIILDAAREWLTEAAGHDLTATARPGEQSEGRRYVQSMPLMTMEERRQLARAYAPARVRAWPRPFRLRAGVE